MKKLIYISLFLLIASLLVVSFDVKPIIATPSIKSAFDAEYGPALTIKYSCTVCHKAGTTELNAYGEDVKGAGAGGPCPEFNPPASHTKRKKEGDCVAKHAPGLETPFSSGCVGCHGSDLHGGIAPSCYTCHGALWDKNDSGGSCPDYNPPSSHTILKSEDGCRAYHAPGYEDPLANGCTLCHGEQLKGDSAPSCYTCHGEKWNDEEDDDDAPPPTSYSIRKVSHASADFKSIENLDSDGDGFSNIEEITALSNPGDSDISPETATLVKGKMAGTWKRSWIFNKGIFKIVIKTKGGVIIDSNSPVMLRSITSDIVSGKIHKRGSRSVIVSFPRALLYALYGENDSELTVIVSGMTDSGAGFSFDKQVKISGSTPALLKGLSATVTPTTYAEGDDLKVQISGADADKINLSKPVYAIGYMKQLALGDVSRSGAVVEIIISADEMNKLLGSLQTGTTYTLGLRGDSTGANEYFAVPVRFTAGEAGTADCKKFNPPGNHTVKKTIGKCTYKHAPGLTDPLNNGCTTCHGADLKGTSFAPSCLLCHEKKW